MAEAEFDLYDTLNVSRDASPEDVKAAHHVMSRLYHPDKQASTSASSSTSGATPGGEAFMRVHYAYEVLSNNTLRQFYDQYGLAAVRLAEGLSDDDGEAERDLQANARHSGQQLVKPEDKLKHLEGRVRRQLQKSEELRVRRLLGLQGTFVLSLASSPGPYGAHLRRRYRVQYSAISQSVQVCLSDNIRLTAGCTGHIQGANGIGASKLMLAVAARLGAFTNSRCSLNFVGPGSAVEGEASLSRQLTTHCSAQQKLAVSANGSCSLSVGFQCWLFEMLHGSLECGFGEQRGLSLNFLRRSASAKHKLKASLRLQPGAGEIGVQAKLKPSKDFSVTISPSISPRGWLLSLDCSKSAPDGLSKLHWVLRLKRCGISLRLACSRAGLRFSIPLELWPESAGPLPLPELCLAVSLWALPPLVLRLLIGGGSLLRERWAVLRKTALPLPDASSSARPVHAQDVACATAAAATAREQRKLLAQAAAQKRQEEGKLGGLEILSARYGDPRHLVDEAEQSRGKLEKHLQETLAKLAEVQQSASSPAVPMASAAESNPPEAHVPLVEDIAACGGHVPLVEDTRRADEKPGVIDVTDCLMAWVRNSHLDLSAAPKSALIGFYNVAQEGGPSPVLCVHYRFGGMVYTRTFSNREVVMLP